ncbi:MAG: hypothetical protein ACRDGT_07035 [Candidatus Limnocylindria bacterium]
MRRQAPEVRWRAVLIGGLVAVMATVLVSYLALGLSSDPLLSVATALGLAAGGATAGRLAGSFGALQGGMVGVFWVLAEAIQESFGPPSGDVLGDVALIILADGARIAVAALFGWLGARTARPASSAGRGRAR